MKLDPVKILKEREMLRRHHRKEIRFNDREQAAIDEYCKRFKIASRSKMMRKAIMECVLEGLDESHPTLF